MGTPFPLAVYNTLMTTVHITIPATSANLGPGFDCLGLALALYNHVEMTTAVAPAFSLSIRGEGAGRLPEDETNLVWQAANALWQQAGQRPSGVHVRLHNHIPVGSGLGSSATAILGGMLAANALIGNPFSAAEVLRLAIAYEGHPDNVVPAMCGGLVLSVAHGAEWLLERVPMPPLQVVYVLPEFDLPTQQARAVLPTAVSRSDAIFNAARLGLLLRALSTANFATLAIAMQDRLHQPYRIPLVPGLASAMEAAVAAGAAGVALSGAGPSLIAFAPANHAAIAQAATDAFAAAGLPSRAWVLPVATTGATVNGRSAVEQTG